MERVIRKFATPEQAEQATREAYREMQPDERVALTVELQRRFFEQSGAPRRLPRVLTVLERP